MAKDSRYIQIACSVQKMLQTDGKLDQGELNTLLGMALQDREIDEDERRILQLIFRQLEPKDLTPEAWVRLLEVREKLEL